MTHDPKELVCNDSPAFLGHSCNITVSLIIPRYNSNSPNNPNNPDNFNISNKHNSKLLIFLQTRSTNHPERSNSS